MLLTCAVKPTTLASELNMCIIFCHCSLNNTVNNYSHSIYIALDVTSSLEMM